VPVEGEPAEEEPFDPIEHRRKIQRESYYRHRDEILAKKAAQRELEKAERMANAPSKTSEELAAEEEARRERRREYQRNYQRDWQRRKRAERNASSP
jgi:Skp family chaperone for outer membrane proteins